MGEQTEYQLTTVHPPKAMNLSDLLENPDLQLHLLTGERSERLPEVRWAAATELEDPTPFLDGGEIVLTTGMGIGVDGGRAYVGRLGAANVAALGFGVGLSHAAVPAELVDSAIGVRLPVFSVPYGTPFVAIVREVAERVIAERHAAELRAVEVHERLASVLLAGEGIEGIIAAASRIVGGPCALVDYHGSVLAAAPPGSRWPVDQILGHRTLTTPWSIGQLRGFPVVLEGEVAAVLCTRAGDESPVLRSVATVMGLELARRTAALIGRRQMLGQVLEDVVNGVLSDDESLRRLERFGLASLPAYAVVVGSAPGAEDRLRQAGWAVRTLIGRHGRAVDTALVDARLAVIVHRVEERNEIARLVHDRLTRLSPDVAVGIGDPYPGIHGLRRSILEAVSAAGRGPGIHDARSMSLAATIALDRSGRALSEAMLGPLVEHDRVSGSDLTHTLAVYLRNDCRPGAAAAELALHRNGLAYRLGQIERLTGRDLGRLEDQAEMLLALRVGGRL